MSEQEVDYAVIRQRVMRRIRNRLIFAAHFALYLIIAAATNASQEVGLLWLPVLFVHFVLAFDVWNSWVEHTTRQEIERMQQANPAADKHKRQKPKRVSLSDDGELIDADDDEMVSEAAQARSDAEHDH